MSFHPAYFNGRILALAAAALTVAACTPSVSQMKKLISDNPEIITEAMEKNPGKFGEAIQKAAFEARRQSQAKMEEDKKKEMEEQYKNPKKVPIADRPLRGPKDAPMVLVVYSDFQCPYCQRGAATVDELKAKYGEKLQVIFKHLPLDFHPMAMPAAKRFEAIAKQSADKAWAFHDLVFKNQQKFSDGEKFLDEMAKKAGANMAQMKKDIDSDSVKKIIEADMKEAGELGVRGTPGFLMNGVVVHGALPAQAFDEIVAKRPTYN